MKNEWLSKDEMSRTRNDQQNNSMWFYDDYWWWWKCSILEHNDKTLLFRFSREYWLWYDIFYFFFANYNKIQMNKHFKLHELANIRLPAIQSWFNFFIHGLHQTNTTHNSTRALTTNRNILKYSVAPKYNVVDDNKYDRTEGLLPQLTSLNLLGFGSWRAYNRLSLGLSPPCRVTQAAITFHCTQDHRHLLESPN